MTTDRWFGRRLNHTCIVQRDSGTAQSSSGEIGTAWTDVGTRRACRFAERMERIADEAGAAVMLKQTLLLMHGTSDVNVDDRIVRVWDKDDAVIHAGPFTVEQLLRRRNVKGTVHHLSLRLERVEVS